MKGFERLFLSKSLEGKLKIEFIKSGIKTTPIKFIKRLLIISFVLSLIGLLFFSGDYLKGRSVAEFPLILINGEIISFFASLGVVGFFTYTWLMVKKNSRKKQIEEILADYLQLVSANVGAGMPIDQALWYAVRERFGILVSEMEDVAKKTISGGDLSEALIDFAEKYDSDLLKKSVVLLVEGLEAGGEVAELINKIAWNVREVQIMRKDISADVVTYVIFIGFAALVAAPLLFALSYRINIIMTTLLSGINLGGATGGASLGGSLDITKIGSGLSPNSFKNFAISALLITSVMSAMIISTVTKGSIKGGIRLIPIFAAVSLLLFFILSAILTALFSGLI
ncbi:MAG TPA: type II secretion system F family protein [Candidatus Nanoarchaeia archaeon]|nr:type II secretion system F family protein [Candidatus Nanoarchaeia archaeon]